MSDAFAAFLGTVALTGENLLGTVFNCTNCEDTCIDGSKLLKSVVLDGTATGILGDLLQFKREAILAESVKDSRKLQFLFAPAKTRPNLNNFLPRATGDLSSIEFHSEWNVQ